MKKKPMMRGISKATKNPTAYADVKKPFGAKKRDKKKVVSEIGKALS